MKQTAVEWLVDNFHYYYSTKWNDIVDQAKEMEQTNTDNKVIHFAEWLTKKHTYTLITLYEQFEEENYGDK
jgi:hypothetical protein